MSETPTRGDLEWGTIPGLLASSVSRFGEAPAVIDGDTTLSFTELAAQSEAAARAYIAAGVEPGDRVGIWAPNIWEWLPAAYGAQLAGGVLVPLNTRYKGAEAEYILRRSGAKVLVTMGEFLGVDYAAMLDAASDADGMQALREIVTLRTDDARSWDAFLERGEQTDVADAQRRAAAVQPSDLSDMLFTSGTTGNPKGVMQTHAATLRAFRSWADVVGLREGDRYLVVNPFFHTFGYKAGMLACLMQGATVFPQTVFEVEDVLGRIERERISVMPGAPSLFQSILNHPRRAEHDLGTLRLVVTGAAPIAVEMIIRMREEMRIETIITGYGLTEACGIATMCRYDDDPETIANTSGRAIPDVEVRVVDDAGNELARGEPGEIVVRGYNVMRGYFEDPEETAATIDAERLAAHGGRRRDGCARLPADHGPHEGHVHRRWLQRLPGGDREPDAAQRGDRPGGGGRCARRAPG